MIIYDNDIYSKYVWRARLQGTGGSMKHQFQPYMVYIYIIK